jgi:heme oxygenase
MSQTIMERLRNETKPAHQQLEKATIPFIKNATNDEQYAFLLRMFYGYFKPVEERIQALVDNTLLEDIEERRQSVALLEDLNTIGAGTDELELSAYVPQLHTVPRAIGALYVLEGSTLGGRFISQMLAKQMNRTADNGIRFFSGYGEHTDEKWKAFTQMINNYAEKLPNDQDQIVAAANETFDKFGQWIIAYTGKAVQLA